MVSSIGSSSGHGNIQQLMSEFRKKLKSADTDGTKGLSKEELSSIDTGDDEGGAGFLDALVQNFDKIDSNADGQLSQSEISTSKPKGPQMGPPPGMMIEDLSSSDTDGVAGLSKDELSKVDTGGDAGKAKFISNVTQNFDKLDTNKDGQVSSEEIEAGKPQGPPPGMMQNQSTDASAASGSSTALGSNDISSYLLKLLSSYKDNSSDLTSSLDLAV